MLVNGPNESLASNISSDTATVSSQFARPFVLSHSYHGVVVVTACLVTSPPSDLGARAAIFPNQKFWGLGFNRNWSGAINIRIPPPEAVRWKRVEIGEGSEGSQAGTWGGGGELPWFISHSVWLSGAEILLLFVVVDCERNHIITLISPPRVIRLRNGTCTYPDHDLYKLRRGKTTIPTLLLWVAVLSCMRLQTFSII